MADVRCLPVRLQIPGPLLPRLVPPATRVISPGPSPLTLLLPLPDTRLLVPALITSPPVARRLSSETPSWSSPVSPMLVLISPLAVVHTKTYKNLSSHKVLKKCDISKYS